MRNRAKCKLCNDIIESFHPTDLVLCKCGEIEIDGGEAMKCAAKDFINFLRVDDNGNEILVKVVGEEDFIPNTILKKNTSKPTRKELILMLSDMVKNIENLPKQALDTYVTHYDLWSALTLVCEVFKSDLTD